MIERWRLRKGMKIRLLPGAKVVKLLDMAQPYEDEKGNPGFRTAEVESDKDVPNERLAVIIESPCKKRRGAFHRAPSITLFAGDDDLRIFEEA